MKEPPFNTPSPNCSMQPKIIVLDDDPTGSQTVHSCLLLLQWDIDTLRLGLRDQSPIFFILTNTRALSPTQATAVTREVCRHLRTAIEAEKILDFLVVSRSDSTLRGHYPIETDVIAEELGPFDAHFLVPAFLEGGRTTRESVHYLRVNGVDTPVHETEFARDSVFGYHHSFLPDYVAEKTFGRIPSSQVTRLLLSDIRRGSQEQLSSLRENQCVVVDAMIQSDLDQFALDIKDGVAKGKRFLFRSAASLLTSLANLGPQPIPAASMASYVSTKQPGVVVIGSHVQKTTEQLQQVLLVPGVVPVEVNVHELKTGKIEARQQLLNSTMTQVKHIHHIGKTPVIFTSRQELTFEDMQTRLRFGETVSTLLMDIIRQLPPEIGFLISKGGITSNDTLSTGLTLRFARLLGQVIPGVSMVKVPDDHSLFPGLPVVLFPGNVGDAHALSTVYQRLAQGKPHH